MKSETWSCVFLVLVVATTAMPPEGRKFAVKPNNPKKLEYMNNYANTVAEKQASASSSNSVNNSKVTKPSLLQKQDNAFSWSYILSMALQFVYNILNPPSATEKNGSTNILQGGEFSWTKIISVVLKVALAGLGADAGIDKVDNGPASPLESMLTAALSILMGSKDPSEVAVMAKQAGELINLGITLLDALKTSFSQRSLQARSFGSSDRFADAAQSSLSLIKGYAQSFTTEDDVCRQKAFCMANQNCVSESPEANPIMCKIATYFMAVGVNRRSEAGFEYFIDAGRRGRLLEDCTTLYPCNEL